MWDFETAELGDWHGVWALRPAPVAEQLKLPAMHVTSTAVRPLGAEGEGVCASRLGAGWLLWFRGAWGGDVKSHCNAIVVPLFFFGRGAPSPEKLSLFFVGRH